ncbi:hypothetical protein E4L96_10480 [Massilia arenosa]|uniref:Uncharacterized protein n=1 Tax=Zemynaea arenosa TaxID=2561931 RepID=A0A4Y9SG11_9BURK|nr:hypothetical protein [Massilia arenosa]TFW20388.1 hypothetical protein E4L96_10480 [Massilia arenosa]
MHINKVMDSDRAYWLLIREQVPQAVIERVLRGAPGQVRKKDRRHATRQATIQEPAPMAGYAERRSDHLTAQRVEVGLVFESMLGEDSAREYFLSSGVPVWVAQRVLATRRKRPSPALVLE